MNEAVFLRREIEKTKQLIQENQYKLKCLEKIRDNYRAMSILKECLVVKEGRINEDSYYEYLTLKDEYLDESVSEIAGVKLRVIKKVLEVQDDTK